MLGASRAALVGASSVGSTVLLLNLNGSNGATSTVDRAGGHTITFNGDAQLSTTEKKFGTASLLLDGAGDFLDVSQDSQFNLSDDFTIECWFRTDVLTSGLTILEFNRAQSGNEFAGILLYKNGANIELYASDDGQTSFITAPSTIATGISSNTWYHLAIAKKGSSWAGWLDGTRGFTLTSSDVPYYSLSAKTTVGASQRTISSTGNFFDGYIDDVRVVNGVAVYDPASASITVPSSELGVV
jgi:hypothetical protein